MMQLPPLSLYIHIPWCVRKCPYCDFNSHRIHEDKELPVEDYLKALEEDLADSAKHAQGRKLSTLFFGGGTPSILSSDAIGRCVTMAKEYVGLEPNAEITLEANPGTFEQEKFSGYRNAGINRLSIGIQSLDDQQLQALGRVHSAGEAKRAVQVARNAGFDNINLDLMFGLPNQTHKAALRDLSTLIELQPNHISWYELTIEPNTEFYRHPPPQPENDQLFEMSEAGIEILKSAGFERYEVSAYATKGKQCRHNLNYWQFGDYLGVGAGAHEKITDAESSLILRRSKTRLPQHFIERIGSRVASEQRVDKADLTFEFCLNALRLIDGVESRLFDERTGLGIEILTDKFKESTANGLIDPSQGRIKPTSLGLQHLNSVLQALLD